MAQNELVKQLIEENLRTQNPYLDLGNCGLDGTEPELEMLADNKQLLKLDLNYNSIQNTTFLNKLNTLQFLNLSHNQIKDVSFIKILMHLKKIDLRANPIECIDLFNYNLSDTEGLQIIVEGLQKIKDILLSDNPNDIIYQSFAKEIDRLTKQFTETGEFEYRGSKEFTNKIISNSKAGRFILLHNNMFIVARIILNGRKFFFNQIDLNYLPINLIELNLSDNYLKNIDFLRNYPYLKRLNLNGNLIQDFSQDILLALPHLEELQINLNPIENIPEKILQKRGNILKDVCEYWKSQNIKKQF